MTALHEEYPNRYPSVCGPASIVLPRSGRVRNTGVPLQLGGTDERFELEIGIFNPGRSSQQKPSEHVYVRYYNGVGGVFYTDPVYLPLWGGVQSPTVPIMEKYCQDEIDQALAEKYSLFPFSTELATELDIDLWCDDSGIPPKLPQDYHDMRAAMHDSRAFTNNIVTDSGDTRDLHQFWGDRTARVLMAVGQSALNL